MTVRRAAYETLLAVTEEGAYANLALKESAQRVSPDEVKTLYALVYTALEHRAYLEYVLSHFCKRQKRAVRTVLLLGGAELLYLNTPAHAAINEAVKLTKSVGKADCAGLVNAVLRRLDRERNVLPPLPRDVIERMRIQYGYPAWVARDWIDSYGSDRAEALMQSRPTQMQIRAQYPMTTETLQSWFPNATAGRLDPNCLYLPEGIDLAHDERFLSGALTAQNEGAMLICRSLGNVKNMRVLDACAAPGGKTAYLASLFQGEIDLVAWELHPHRKALLDATLKRLHVKAMTECRDASVPYADAIEAFDAVLLDVPCTGLGLLADKPDVRYRKTESDRDAIAAIQREILSACSAYARHGGTLVYATCTISRAENEEQVRAFLAAHPDYTLQSERQYLPDTDGIDGFYHAVLKRG